MMEPQLCCGHIQDLVVETAMLQILRWWLIDVTRGAKHVAIPQVVIASVVVYPTGW